MAIAALITLLPACVSKNSADNSVPPIQDSESLQPSPTTDQETKLRRIAKQDFQSRLNAQAEGRNKVLRLKPYFYKEFFDYPQGIDSFRLNLHEKESRTTPLFAEISITETRFATELQKKKVNAQADTNFLRETGTQTVSYEMRAGKWRRIASIFVSDSREEFVDGQWRALETGSTSEAF